MRRKKPRTFTIPVEMDKKVEILADGRPYSATLCKIIQHYLDSLPPAEQKKLNDIVSPPKVEAPTIPRLTTCPACKDTQNVINYPNGKWRCNLCMEEGTRDSV